MYISKNFTLKGVLSFGGFHLIWLSLWAIIVACLYRFTNLSEFNVPWLPISVIGTSVAFYVGFKNNQAYDRYWEARKIWGSIINSSRMWGSTVITYIKNWEKEGKLSASEIKNVKEQLIYRHIAYVYTLREQLLVPAPWEHQALNNHVANLNIRRAQQLGTGLIDAELIKEIHSKYLSVDERSELATFKNTATHINHQQALQLAAIREKGLLEDFRHIELQKIVNEFYDHQGKAERIKKTPLPRQYGASSFIFVCIFILLFPFSMVSEFSKLGEYGIWFSIPFVVLTGWIFVMMELIGDYSENPFEGLSNDVAMFSICRTIEIDLLQMLGEKKLPEPVQAVKGVLM